jgi:hypothetical protein
MANEIIPDIRMSAFPVFAAIDVARHTAQQHIGEGGFDGKSINVFLQVVGEGLVIKAID